MRFIDLDVWWNAPLGAMLARWSRVSFPAIVLVSGWSTTSALAKHASCDRRVDRRVQDIFLQNFSLPNPSRGWRYSRSHRVEEKTRMQVVRMVFR